MNQENINEINLSYLGLLAKIELLITPDNRTIAVRMLPNIERDILEVSALYDSFADNTGNPLARNKQIILDKTRRAANGKTVDEKLRIYRRLHSHEKSFIDANS